MTREHALVQAIQRTMKAAKTLDEAKVLFHEAIAEIYPFEFELEQADKQRELVFDFNKVVEQDSRESA